MELISVQEENRFIVANARSKNNLEGILAPTLHGYFLSFSALFIAYQYSIFWQNISIAIN